MYSIIFAKCSYFELNQETEDDEIICPRQKSAGQPHVELLEDKARQKNNKMRNFKVFSI